MPVSRNIWPWLALAAIASTAHATDLPAARIAPLFAWPNPAPVSAKLSANGLQVATATKNGNQVTIAVGGKANSPYDAVYSFSFSAHGDHYAYAARKGTQWVVVRDGKEGKAYDKILSGFNDTMCLLFSPDGQHLAYIAQKNGQGVLVEDGQESAPFDIPNPLRSHPLIFSPDGQHLACLTGDGRQIRVLLDGRLGPLFDAVQPVEDPWIVFSPNSQHSAYFGLTQGNITVIKDGSQPVATFENLIQLGDGNEIRFYDGPGPLSTRLLGNFSTPLLFSPDSQHLAFLAFKSSHAVVVLDGKEGPAYNRINGETLTFSPDSQHLAYMAQKGADMVAVMDGHEGPAYNNRVFSYCFPVFSGDSKHMGYLAADASQYFAVIDNVEQSKLDDIGTALTLSADGKHFAYLTFPTAPNRQSQHTVIADGQPGPIFSAIRDYQLTYNADGQRLYYVGERSANEVLVINQKEVASYPKIGQFTLSPDGQHYGYWAKKGAKWVMVIDGVESAPYDDPTALGEGNPPAPVFHQRAPRSSLADYLLLDSAGPEWSAEYLALRNGTVYRVTQPLSDAP